MAIARRTQQGAAFQPQAFQPAPAYQASVPVLLNTPELVRDVLFRAGEPLDQVSDFYDQVVGYLNRAEITLAAGGQEFEPSVQEAWRWHRSANPGVLIFMPPWKTTVQVTQGSLTATFEGIPPRNILGEIFVTDVPARPEVVNAGGQVLTWDAPWVGPDATIEGEFWKLNYSLMPDVLRVLDPMRILLGSRSARTYEISAIDRLQMERHWPVRDTHPGVPEAYAIAAYNIIRINRPASEIMRAEYDFMQAPPVLYDDPGSVPREPVEYRYTLADMALYYLFCDKDDNRRDNIGTQARNRVISMRDREKAIEAQTASHYGHIFPRGGVGVRQ
jgi:hypothetical protein